MKEKISRQALLGSYDNNGVLGALTGASEAEQSRFFQEAWRRAQTDLKQAQQQAKRNGSDVVVDASTLSGVNGADRWIVTPEGAVRRRLDAFPEVERALRATMGAPGDTLETPALDEARPLLARAAYNGLWSPSGTNWQPIRTVELTTREYAGLFGRPPGPIGWLVLARARYDSILSDVARLCGLEQASHAESIDLGIWLHVVQLTARFHGWQLQQHPIPPARRGAVTTGLIAILERRVARLETVSRSAAESLLTSLRAGEHQPVLVLLPARGRDLRTDSTAPGGLRPSSFDRLVEARSTQRVASPHRDLDRRTLDDLWERARSSSGAAASEDLDCAVFTWRDEMPARIGQAMHAGIEGPEGLLQRIDLMHLHDALCRCAPLPEAHRAWSQIEADRLEERFGEIPLPADQLPVHIRDKLCTSGQYRFNGYHLLDQRQRPLTPKRLVKLLHMLARSFGSFFLRFHNTHPLLGVISARSDLEPEHQRRCYVDAGRAVAHMTLLARSRGLVSIIKSGPVEIAREGIRQLLIEHTADAERRRRVRSGELSPLLTFQVGHPLSPNDRVSAGQPDEHDGLLERKLDKRATRAPLAAHYIPHPDPAELASS